MLTLKHPYLLKYQGHLLPAGLLCLIVLVFWAGFASQHVHRFPEYNVSEVEAIQQVDPLSMWFWTDYKSFHRYTPTGLLLIGLLDRHIIAPLAGVDFSDTDAAVRGERFMWIFHLSFVGIAFLTYTLVWKLFGHRWIAFLAGLYFGVNKAFFYFYLYTDTIAECMLLLYAIPLLLFWRTYLRSGQRKHLVGFYVFFALCVGAWEQWVNLLAFLICFTLYQRFRAGKWNRKALLHGVAVPSLVFVVFVTLRWPTMIEEVTVPREVQFVFSYPKVSMMVEDMAVNTSHHIADTVDSLLFPWPMMSQAVLHNYDMREWNRHNEVFPYGSMHYRYMTDWYSGVLLGAFIILTVLLLRRFRERGEIASAGAIGLILIWTGFLVHLPIMYREVFVMPGRLLGYKHVLSLLGASILLGWLLMQVRGRIRSAAWSRASVVLLASWILFCSATKILLSKSLAYPW